MSKGMCQYAMLEHGRSILDGKKMHRRSKKQWQKPGPVIEIDLKSIQAIEPISQINRMIYTKSHAPLKFDQKKG